MSDAELDRRLAILEEMGDELTIILLLPDGKEREINYFDVMHSICDEDDENCVPLIPTILLIS